MIIGSTDVIRSIVAASHMPLQEGDIEICQRVFDQICIQKVVTGRQSREDLAAAVIDLYRHGIRNEDSLKRLFS